MTIVILLKHFVFINYNNKNTVSRQIRVFSPPNVDCSVLFAKCSGQCVSHKFMQEFSAMVNGHTKLMLYPCPIQIMKHLKEPKL